MRHTLPPLSAAATAAIMPAAPPPMTITLPKARLLLFRFFSSKSLVYPHCSYRCPFRFPSDLFSTYDYSLSNNYSLSNPCPMSPPQGVPDATDTGSQFYGLVSQCLVRYLFRCHVAPEDIIRNLWVKNAPLQSIYEAIKSCQKPINGMTGCAM